MHQSESFGDYLSDIRLSIKIANSEKRYVSGFEEGRVFNGFRYVHPLFYNGKHVGSVETSLSASSMMEHMNSINRGLYQMYFDKNIVLGTVWNKEIGKSYKQSSLSAEMFSESNTKEDILIVKINKSIATSVADELKHNKPFLVDTRVDGKNYVASFLPIYGISGAHAGYLAKYTEDNSLSYIKNDFWLKAAIDICATVALMFIVILLRREVLLKEHAQKQLEILNNSLNDEVRKQIQLIQTKDQLLFRQSKHAAMGEMISAIAHQWKQPLNSLWLSIQDLYISSKLGEVDDSYTDDFYTKSKKQIEHMNKTIDNFKNFFKTGQQKEVVDAMKVVKQSCDLVYNQFLTYKIELEIIGGSFQSYGRSSELSHVVINLINNAKDQILSAGKDQKQVVKKIQIRLFTDELGGHIVVEDFAGGITDENIAKLFDAYFTTKEDSGGTGIGLYMSKLIIVDLFNGSINVYNGTEGAVFDIILPLYESSASY